MPTRSASVLALVLATLLSLAGGAWAQGQAPLLERDVLPILQRNCQGCHGGLKQEGGLDLRTVPAMLKGGENGPAVKAGDAGASLLWKRVSRDEMPEGDKKLSAADKAVLQTWIAAGMPTVADRLKQDRPQLAPGARHEPGEVALAIDRHLEGALAAAKRKPAAVAGDAEFLRRAYLDLNGRVPTAEQAAAFLDSQAPDKRARLIDSLLESPQFGVQLGRTWRDWICPPELPSDANGGRQPHNEAQNLGKWLGERFAAGDSWDQIVRAIVTVEGEIKSQPQVIFFGLVGSDGKTNPAGSARSVASLFLGVQLQCAECHDDPYRSWAQRDFWSLAAFFGRANGDFGKISESAAGKDASQIVIPKTAFRNAGSAVPAQFLGGKPLEAVSGSLRAPFVEWLTAKDNPYFSRAFVNRLWFYLFSRGLVNPVDDMRELNPPSHPGLLELLGNEFTASGYDVKHLVRCVCASQGYQRTSRVAGGAGEAEIAAQTQLFGRTPLRVMTADVLYDSLKLAYGDPKLDLRGIDPKDGNTNGESAPVADAYLEFLRRFGTNEDDATDFTHGIPQMLTMLNHPRLLSGSKALDDYLKTKPAPAPEQVVEWLYLSTLSRRPTADESAEALDYLRTAPDPAQARIGLLWTLVNRSEYLLVR